MSNKIPLWVKYIVNDLFEVKPGTYKVKARCYCDYKGKRYYGAFSKPTTFKMK